MAHFGKVLWWSTRDENGIIIDEQNNEYYFDRSVLARNSQTIKTGKFVSFEINTLIKECLCARNVKLATAAKQRAFKKSRQFRLDLDL